MAVLPPARPGSENGGPEGRDEDPGNLGEPSETPSEEEIRKGRKEGPYARAWREYLEGGWNPLPVVGKAGNLPVGYTGETGKSVTAVVAAQWAATRGVDNLGVRLPVGVVGIDVDDYDGKNGWSTLVELIKANGPLPATWSTSARDGRSRQLLYRTPPHLGVRLPGVLGPGVEVIQHHHRYTVCWPSVHPGNRPDDPVRGKVYTWYAPDGTPSDRPPRVEELAELPEAWHSVAPLGAAKPAGGGGSAGYTNPDVDSLLLNGIPVGVNQDEALRDLVWKLVAGGASDAQVELQWLAVVSRTPLTRVDEPWTADDFQRHLRGARQKLGGGVGRAERAWVAGVGAPRRTEPSEEDAAPVGDVWAALVPEAGYLVPDGYTVDRDGITVRVVRNKGRKNEETSEEPVAVRPFAVRRRYRDDRGETRFELVWLTDDEVVRSRVVTAEDVRHAPRLVEAFPDVVVTGVTASRAVAYVAELLRVNREWLVERGESVATALGWPLDRGDRSVFTLGPGRPRRVDDVKNTGAWLAGHEPRGTLRAWQAVIGEVADRELILMLLAGGLAAPLLRVLGAANFAVDLSGPTSGGKTTALAAAASAWGDPARLLVSWKNTRVAVEHHLSMVRGMPLCLNESQLADVAMVEDVVYSLTEGHSKGRSRQDGSGLLDGSAWETVALSTGEQPLTAVTRKGGITPRVVALTGQPCRDKAQADALLAGVRECHGTMGAAFLARLAELGEEALRRRYQAARAFFTAGELTPVAGRRADSVAVMALAARVAEEAGLLPAVSAVSWRWLVGGGGAGGDDEDDRALAALREVLAWAAANAGRFFGCKDAGGDLWLGSPPGGWLGRWEAGEYVSFDPATLRKKLVDLGYDQGRVVADWRDRGWLRHAPGKSTHAVRLGPAGVARHVVVTHLADLEEADGEAGVTDGRLTAARKWRDEAV